MDVPHRKRYFGVTYCLASVNIFQSRCMLLICQEELEVVRGDVCAENA
jgi:hypothetical protein